MIYVPSSDIKNTAAGQKTLYVKETMDKSNLDRSSRSVIDAYKLEFYNIQIGLDAYKKYLFDLLDLATDLEENLTEQLKLCREHVGLDVPATEKGEKELEEIEKILEQLEKELNDLKEGIYELIECMSTCYAGGQGETTCIAACEMNCQGGCLTNCQTGCEVQCQGNCEATSQYTCQSVTEQTVCNTICESYCQTGCQTNVQYTCYESCEQHCQDTRQIYAQDGCRMACDSGDGGVGDVNDVCSTAFESNTDDDGDVCWESCPPAYGACGPDFAACNNSSICPPLFGGEAGCDDNQGCGACEKNCQQCEGNPCLSACQGCFGGCDINCNTNCFHNCNTACTDSCNTGCLIVCYDCEGSCQGGCNTTCATGEGGCQSVCILLGQGGCQTTCATGEACSITTNAAASTNQS